MIIGILSRNPESYSICRLVQACQEKGHQVEVIDFHRCTMVVNSKSPTIIYDNKTLDYFDAIIPRVSASSTFYGTAVVRQFEMMGVFAVNGSMGISRSRDKLRCLQILARKNLGMPLTGFAHSTLDVNGLINTVGGAPLVIKLVEGTQGLGVVLAETKKAAECVIEAFRGLNANILVQEFVKEAEGCDIRCFVVGDKVVASMMRTAPPGEFRSNLHRGGKGTVIKITPAERAMAISAAKEMRLNIAGVDIIRSKHGPCILEVNSSPGLEGIENTTQVNVADRIIDFIEKNAGKKGKRNSHVQA